MNRRQALEIGVGVAAFACVPSFTGAATAVPKPKRKFRLRYAPHFGMFKHHAGDDHVDQLRFMHEHGFTAIEDNGMANRPVELQEKIANEMTRLGMTMGVFVSMADFKNVTFASNKPENTEQIVKEAQAALETAKRCNAKWTTIVPGCYDTGVEWDFQTAYVIDNLRRVAEVFEPSGLIAVLEPLNHWTDHKGVFLTGVPQAYQICKALGSPSIKILDDLYHQQITEGNLIPNMDRAWDEIAYFQVGDNPGRKEPTTGEINYKNVFRHLHEKGFAGIVGMEHGNAGKGKEGEKALINAYVYCDRF